MRRRQRQPLLGTASGGVRKARTHQKSNAAQQERAAAVEDAKIFEELECWAMELERLVAKLCS